jgi:hypothetical protein
MENAIATILMIGLLLVGVMTMNSSSMNAVDSLSTSWKVMESQESTARQTSIAISSCLVYDLGARVEISVRNNGQTALAHFDKWDLLVRYSTGNTQWLRYAEASPGWWVDGITIYSNGASEVIDPGILNPGEVALIKVWLDPAVNARTNNWLKISTANGIAAETFFDWTD